MYYVQYSFGGVFKTVASFSSIDKALYFIKYNRVIHDIDINLVRICHKGMVITLNENTLKKTFK